MKRQVIATGVTILISDSPVKIDIIRNEDGNLEFVGIGSVTYGMLNEELTLHRYREVYEEGN